LAVELHVAAIPVVTTRMVSIIITILNNGRMLTLAITSITIHRFFCFCLISLSSGGVTVRSNYRGSVLFMRIPIVAELPNCKEFVFRWSVTPSPKGAGPKRTIFLAVPFSVVISRPWSRDSRSFCPRLGLDLET